MWIFQLKSVSICKSCWRYVRRSYSASFSHKRWTSEDVRSTFIDYFMQKHDHKFVPSSSVLAGKGQGTYFTNAGMMQFKPIFLGKVSESNEMFDYTRVVNSQKCIRVGGKHNDLEAVGRDLTHHTFFEMLGSWSFGDYFKKEACEMALDLLLNVYKIPISRLYFTYFEGMKSLGIKPDLETRDIWLSQGVPKERVLGFGMKDNFWDMGATGPCGPCTEIHFDHTGEGSGRDLVNSGDPRVVEIWNLVFMQYERKKDGSLKDLPRCHVDTGMGLERILAVLNGTTSNYDTDLFIPMFNTIAENCKIGRYSGEYGDMENTRRDTAYRIIADHIRMATVTIADGLYPSSKNDGFVLRSVLTNCFLQGHKILSLPEGVIPSLSQLVVENLESTYPEMIRNHSRIKAVLEETETWFSDTFKRSETVFHRFLEKNFSQNEEKMISVDEMLNLMEGKHGHNIPLHMLEHLVSQHHCHYDAQLLATAIQEKYNKEQNNNDTDNTATLVGILQDSKIPTTDDSHKYTYKSQSGKYVFEDPFTSNVLAIISDDAFVDSISKGDHGMVVLDKTNFYGEAGGQMGDVGTLSAEGCVFEIMDTQRYGEYVLHIGVVKEGTLTCHSPAKLHLDQEFRLGCMRNHTATHLLRSALCHTLGQDVQQTGSEVSPYKLSFQFTSLKKLENDDLLNVENDVKDIISNSLPVFRKKMLFREAKHLKNVVYLQQRLADYPEEVYVVDIEVGGGDLVPGWNCAELCGGTHVHNTADIEEFCITKVTSSKLSEKIISCLTGPEAKEALSNSNTAWRLINRLQDSLENSDDYEEMMKICKDISTLITTTKTDKLRREMIENKLAKLKKELTLVSNEYFHNLLKTNFKFKMHADKNSQIIILQRPILDMYGGARALLGLKCKERVLVLVAHIDSNAFVIICSHKDLGTECTKAKEAMMKKFRGWTVSRQSKKDFVCNIMGIKAEKVLGNVNFLSDVQDMLSQHLQRQQD